MNRVAALLVAVVSFGMVACSLDKPAEATKHEGAEIKLAGAMPVADEPAERAIDSGVSEDLQAASVLDEANVEMARDRDAKEAAEEAARKIRDVTLGAAAKIKEVGLGAVQAVREGSGDDDQPIADTGLPSDES